MIKISNIVYRYTNKTNGKVYIGRTSQTLKQRAGKDGKGYSTCSKFWNAICKYGWNNFDAEILATDVTFEQSVELERKYIDQFHSDNPEYGYNILAQEPGNGYLTEEVRRKISQSHIGLKPGMHKREKRTLKYERTAEHCQHLSEALKGNIPWNKGKKTGALKDETKQKMSDIRKGNTNSIHVAVRNIDTGEVFRSGAAAGRSVGCTSEAIFASIKNGKPCKGYMFERVYE